jgi:hypothetical protein
MGRLQARPRLPLRPHRNQPGMTLHMNKIPYLIAMAAAALFAGCETESPYFDSQLGTSTAHMVRAQTLDPAAAGNPPALAPAGGNGERIENAVQNYHKDVPRPEEKVSRPIVFEVSGGGGGGG